MKLYTVGFLFNNERNEVLLIQKKRPDWQKGYLNGIGGHIEEDESPLECMTREFYEEADIKIFNWEELAIITDEETWKVHFYRTFVADDIFNSYESKTDEEVIGCIFRKDEYDGILLPNNVIKNLNWLIPMAIGDDPGIPFYIVEKGA